MNEYTREQLLNKLKNLVNESEFISSDIITYWESLDDDTQLSELIVIIYDNLENEKTLSDEEKKVLTSTIIDINKKRVELYKKHSKEARDEAEKLDNENDPFDEKLLDF
jgi:hypothetical protein